MATDVPNISERERETPPNAAQDAQTITDALRSLEAAGYTGQFRALEGARVECFTCHQASPARELAVEEMIRLEGPTDPADMVAAIALTCPRCSARGTLVLSYGPDSTLEDAEALQALGDERERRGVADAGTSGAA